MTDGYFSNQFNLTCQKTKLIKFTKEAPPKRGVEHLFRYPLSEESATSRLSAGSRRPEQSRMGEGHNQPSTQVYPELSRRAQAIILCLTGMGKTSGQLYSGIGYVSNVRLGKN